MCSISKLSQILIIKSANRFSHAIKRTPNHSSSVSALVWNRLCHSNHTIDGPNSDKDIERIFLRPRVQTLLKRLIGFDDQKVFAAKPRLTSHANEVRFMTDNELNLRLEMSRKKAAEKIAMPPVLAPKEDNPRVLSFDPEIQGYIDSKFVFVDSSAGYSDQTRLIVIRETNGVLREANREERYRMNQLFFPIDERLMETPKMFFEPNLTNVLDRHEYEFVLNRACLQLEPNDPKYIEICQTTYEHIVANSQFGSLQSTRHFGPFCYYLAFNSKIDKLLNDYILRESVSDASALVQLFYVIHSQDSQLLDEIHSEVVSDLPLIKKYISEESKEKSILELSLQKYEEIQREKASLNEDINRAHGLSA